MACQRKTISHWEVRANHGYGDGFECVGAYLTRHGGNMGAKEYRDNCPGVPVKVVEVREQRSSYTDADLKRMNKEAELETQNYWADRRAIRLARFKELAK